jgi:hypothetical protein
VKTSPGQVPYFKGDPPGVVGHEAQVVDRDQFDERDAAAGLRIEDADFGMRGGPGIVARWVGGVVRGDA